MTGAVRSLTTTLWLFLELRGTTLKSTCIAEIFLGYHNAFRIFPVFQQIKSHISFWQSHSALILLCSMKNFPARVSVSTPLTNSLSLFFSLHFSLTLRSHTVYLCDLVPPSVLHDILLIWEECGASSEDGSPFQQQTQPPLLKVWGRISNMFPCWVLFPLGINWKTILHIKMVLDPFSIALL